MTSVTLQRTIPASPAQVYRAWLDPELLLRWSAPVTWEAVRVEVDERVGGHYRNWHVDAQGREVGGYDCEILELVPDERIVLRWPFVGPDRRPPRRGRPPWWRAGERVVGAIQVQSDGIIQAHLSMLLIDSRWRGRGPGSQLLREPWIERAACSSISGPALRVTTSAWVRAAHWAFRLLRANLGLGEAPTASDNRP